jgi:hypothetical protein
LIYNLLPDIPRELTGLAEWLGCLVYILQRRRKLNTFQFIALAILSLVGLIAIQRFAGTLPLGLWTGGMAAAVAGMYAFIAITTRKRALDVGYLTARAFVLAELVAALHWQLHTFFFLNPQHWLLPIVFGIVIYGGALFGAFLLERKHFSQTTPLDINRSELASAVAIAGITFFMANLSFINAQTPFNAVNAFDVFYIRTLVCLFGFVTLYAQHGQREQQREMAKVILMNEMLHQQHAHYLQSKRSTEAVRRIYHDLKHQIVGLRAEIDPERRATHLDSLEATISCYGTRVETGNGVLDVVLTAKAQEFAEHGVEFTCVVDGSVLSFISAIDLATLFGNALDNALEGSLTVANPEQRLVRVAAYERNGFILATFENYFTGEIQVHDGVIATSKSDKDRHGIGLDSIRRIATAYGGSSTVTLADGWFNLRILFPITGTNRTARK